MYVLSYMQGILRTIMGRKVIKDDEYHRIERERVAKQRERSLTQNQEDALAHLREGGMVAVKGKQVKYTEPSRFILQRNTFVSLYERGLLKYDHSDEEYDYYSLKAEVYTENDKK